MPDQRKTPGFARFIKRVVIVWGIQTIALVVMAVLMDGVWVENLGVAIVAAAVIGLLNALLWPILSYVLLPFAVLTLGIAALLVNGFMVWLAAEFVAGFDVYNFWAAFWLSLGITAVNIIISSLLTIDDDQSWYRNVVKRRMKRSAKPVATDKPGLIFIEVDGLAKPILEKAVREGYLPTFKRWLEDGSHVLTGWETDTSSQTSASQAGILHGNNSNIPAFRWYDKASGQVIASSNPKLLPQIEAERSDGNGLLSDDGASRGNLFSGDAPFVMTTASAIGDPSKFHTSEFQAFFLDPYNAARTLLLFIWDIILEWRQFRRARKEGVQPILDKHHRGGIYPILRAFMTVLMRELNIQTLVGDIFAGRSAAYATFVGYDEIAHHSGILDPGAFDILKKLDQQFARVAGVISQAPRPYHLVVLSDHGQTGGATFLQRYGKTLEQFVQSLMTSDVQVIGAATTNEGANNLNLFLTDTIHNEDSSASKVMARVVKGQTVDGQVSLVSEGDEVPPPEGDKDEDEQPAVYALASGNLGLVSFTQWPQRMTKEEIDEAFPAVIPGLVGHEGIGFIMLRSEQQGPVVIGDKGTYFLDEDRFEGENPLEVFGLNAADHLRRTNSFPNCPDILVNSFYDPDNNEGCAFEELIGFHGGMGGTQTQPFLMHPPELVVEGELVGAASVYKVCKSWLNQVQDGVTNKP